MQNKIRSFLLPSILIILIALLVYLFGVFDTNFLRTSLTDLEETKVCNTGGSNIVCMYNLGLPAGYTGNDLSVVLYMHDSFNKSSFTSVKAGTVQVEFENTTGGTVGDYINEIGLKNTQITDINNNAWTILNHESFSLQKAKVTLYFTSTSGVNLSDKTAFTSIPFTLKNFSDAGNIKVSLKTLEIGTTISIQDSLSVNYNFTALPTVEKFYRVIFDNPPLEVQSGATDVRLKFYAGDIVDSLKIPVDTLSTNVQSAYMVLNFTTNTPDNAKIEDLSTLIQSVKIIGPNTHWQVPTSSITGISGSSFDLPISLTSVTGGTSFDVGSPQGDLFLELQLVPVSNFTPDDYVKITIKSIAINLANGDVIRYPYP